MKTNNNKPEKQTEAREVEEKKLDQVNGGLGISQMSSCPYCGSFYLVRSGNGLKCLDCGQVF